jgi:hypothetical protein
MTDRIQEIPSLLHDARLTDWHWDEHLRWMRWYFACLRRNEDGSPVEDTTVELRMEGVEQVVAYYAPARCDVRPSQFVVRKPLSPDDLAAWSGPPTEAFLAINSRQADFGMATSCVRDVLVGGDNGGHSGLRIHLSFVPHSYAPDSVVLGLLVVCDSLQPFATGVPLDIETWTSQFEAWWAGWRRHWAAEPASGRADDREPCLEATFIPAGQSPSPDLSYRQPQEPPFQVEPTDAPVALLRPIEDFHTCLHGRDWRRMASAFPDFDQSNDERALQLSEQYLSHDFGRWLYVRRVDSWWCEGNRACVVVRGIEHTLPDDGEPSRDEETVVTYGLRRFEDRWIIATWSQGWPRFGSAPNLPGRQTWRDIWRLAE